MGLSAAAIIAIVGVAIAAAGTGVGIYAAQQQAEAQRRQLKFQKAARKAEAESARMSAEYEEDQFRRRLSILMGKQSAITSASGLDPVSGSPLLMELDTARQGELEALNIRRTGAISAAGSELEARLTGLKIKQAGQAGTYSTIATGLQGANSVLSSWSSSQGYNRRPASYDYH